MSYASQSVRVIELHILLAMENTREQFIRIAMAIPVSSEVAVATGIVMTSVRK